ncbi:MmgE/PrpD family protein [Chelativorans sp. J32]|uniref:MmgE/PrpD family protein n=1 Tax=Chelativorans sp. J32 TaxID=935840 RepID=UPI00048A053B|nr:MmgE/PrpD family protein [Chelativorans sp. J32]
MAETITYRDEVAELLADFTVNVSGELDENTRHAAKRALSDSVAVALGALDHPASHIARKFAAQFATPNGDVIWGTSMRANPDLAAFVNGSLLRCFDYNDFYVGERNSGHPSDMVAGVIAAAEWTGASGEDLLVALSVGYEMVGAVFDAFSTAPGGWDYTNLTGIGACAAIARLLKLDVEQAREAFGIAVIPHFASDEVESCELNKRGDLTLWKRFNGSDAVRNALQACFLAQAGVEAAVRPFTGNNGFIAKLANKHDPIPVLKERLRPEIKLSRIAETYMKLWPVGSVGQSAIRAALEARSKISDLSQIKEVRVFSEEGAYDHLVAIRQDPYRPISRETADHSMPYIVGAAVLDGYIGVDSFDIEKVREAKRQKFVAENVKVFPAPELGTLASGKLARAAAGYLSRVEIELQDGTVAHGEAKPFPGHPKNPFSDADIAQKVTQNAEPFAGREVTEQIIKALVSFEKLSNVKDFTKLLAFDWAAKKIDAAA